MAKITLDQQNFYTGPPMSRDPWAPNRSPTISLSGRPETPQRDGRDSRRVAGASQDEALVISSDDESTYSDLDDDESDASLPPIEELALPARREEVGFGSVADAGKDFISPLDDGRDDGAVERPVSDEPHSRGRTGSSHQRQACGLGRSHDPPAVAALSRRSSASAGSAGALQAEQGLPIPAGCPLFQSGHAPAPDDTTCGKTADYGSPTTQSGAGSTHVPNPGRLAPPSRQPDDNTHRKNTPRRDSASDGGTNGIESKRDGDTILPAITPAVGSPVLETATRTLILAAAK
ncbi:hypothetical protein NKR23_g8944 [Pleurostoma richardsiae]|uniref:Uncharacterized protein n=1 Tax=Pleurostoma richardsiae TaxID=41990 RepID=A0AA38R5B5_9PEZI|nr:hypothetical protein NKR23_g8944 [Pleurostoma richardsiae]